MTARNRTQTCLVRAGAAAAVAVAALSVAVQAQPAALTPAPDASARFLSLRQVFDAAWARQPEALALQSRRDAARAQQRAANAWTPEPAALELANKTDRLNRNQGARESTLGVAVPLWLPGERSRSVALADAESVALESRALAAQLRLAATVRASWWQWQRTRIEAATAREQLDNVRLIAADVGRRTKAGDLARADQHQADGAVASAEARLAHAEAALVAARQLVLALGGAASSLNAVANGLAEPDPGSALADVEVHAELQALKDRVTVTDRIAALTATQSSANPELLLATTWDRSASGEAAQQSVTLALRIPFGGGARVEARSAGAHADAAEARAHLALERERLVAEGEIARVRVQGARRQLEATERRARLARELRGFFEKSFQLGETDLPTRLRIESEAADAEREAARIGVELAAAISAWRQALGLIPQ